MCPRKILPHCDWCDVFYHTIPCTGSVQSALCGQRFERPASRPLVNASFEWDKYNGTSAMAQYDRAMQSPVLKSVDDNMVRHIIEMLSDPVNGRVNHISSGQCTSTSSRSSVDGMYRDMVCRSILCIWSWCLVIYCIGSCGPHNQSVSPCIAMYQSARSMWPERLAIPRPI